MKLIGDTGGKWPRVQDSLAQDLATIQRQFNLLQQTVAAQASSISALQLKLANQNIAIAPSGPVSGLPGSRGLTSISHDSSLSGLGTANSPLKVSNSFTTALSSTINQTLCTVANASLLNLNTTPLLILPGTAGKIIHVTDIMFIGVSGVGTGITGGNNGITVIYETGASIAVHTNSFSPGFANNNGGPGATQAMATRYGEGITNISSPNNIVGKGLRLSTAANFTALGTGTRTLYINILYNLLTAPNGVV